MSKTNCSNCIKLNSIADGQKTKIQLLETRLKDVVRAYKVVCKEKDNLTTISSNVPSDVNANQQKRIAELEESVIHMSALCGKLESERKQNKDVIKKLENKCDKLEQELCSTQSIPKPANILDCVPKPVEFKNKASQTLCTVDEKKSNPIRVVDKDTQTDEIEISEPIDNKINLTPSINKSKNETAVVAPLRHNSFSDSENSDSNDLMLNSVTSHLVNNNSNEFKNQETISTNDSGVSLFYINELARKEIELAEYRLRVREYECSLRELQWKYTNDKYRMQSRIADLELLNNNFMASKSDMNTQLNNVNVAYIRNVLTKLLETKDKEQKQIMINALLTALNSIQGC